MASTVSSTPLGFIAPRRFATALSDLPPRTHWSYVKDRNGVPMTEPVVGFYFNPPADAKCRWSTDHGRREPQHLQFGWELPQRALVLWNDAKLEYEAAYYRQKYWEDMKTLTAPQRFEDLYEYFDSATIWTHGAINLWNLMNLLVADAHTNWQEHERRVATECNDWILDWLNNFPSAQFNRDNLKRWNQQTDILTAVLTHYDWMNDLKDLDMVGQNIMRECMLYHYKRLTGNEPPVACFNHRATDPPPVPAPAPGLVMASTNVASDDLPDGQPGLKVGASPPQGLATIPEHASPVKASAKAKGLTIDTTASTKIPKYTVSAPATAVPYITVTPQIPGQAEVTQVHKDGNDSTDDEFFDPQALATQIEVKARQLSAHSAPVEDSEPMLNAGRSQSQPRASSTILQPAVLQKIDALSRHTVPEKHTAIASSHTANFNTNKLPTRAARKSPPRGPLPRRHAVASVPTYQPLQHPMVQQGPPVGPPPQPQHMMSSFGPQNGMLQQQPPAGFMPPTPPHGMPPYPSASAPQGPHPPNALAPQGPPPPGVGMPPTGPSGAPFQNQFPMPQPQMDMPQFNQPQGHPMNAPPGPQYTAQPNIGVPLYQPNGYIAQSQQQPGAFNGNRQISQNSRRGSMNSNTSRKLRDDPIHGPVYAMNPRKFSNASTGHGTRRPSNANPEQVPQGPSVTCVNAQPYRSSPDKTHFGQLYDECPCSRCVEASRSVFVKHHDSSLAETKIKYILLRYFAAWNPIRVRLRSHTKAATVLFHTDHDAVSAIQSFWSAGDKHNIPGLSKDAYIWYPLYSRHYNPMGQTPTGAPRGLVAAQNTSRRLSNTSMPRRGSNPYLGQRPVFNNPNFGNGAPGLQQLQQLPQQMAGQPNISNPQPGPMYAVPYQPQPPQASQRALWVAPANGSRRKASTTAPAKEEKEVSPKPCPENQAEGPLRKEDWRSKPPSEEAIEDLGDEVAVADTASNVSSQGSRSIAVCLPIETGSARSRSASPEVEDVPAQDRAKEEPKVEEPELELKKGDAPATVEEPPTKDEDAKSSSSYNKAASELVEPAEELQPIVAPKRAQATEEVSQKTDYSYNKVMSELTGPTETIDLNTVIRHKPHKLRNPLPIEWADEPDGGRSELQSRFADLQDEFQADIQDSPAPALATEETGGTDEVAAPEVPEELATQQEPQAKQSKKSRGKNKKQAQVDGDAPTSGPSCNTPTDVQSRVPSRASTSRPTSRASAKHPLSATSTTAESSRPSSAMQVHQELQAPVADDGAAPPKKKKNSKAQRKRKQALAAEASASSEGQAKTGGSQDQDQGRAVSGQESPKKKPKTLHPGPEPGPVEKPSVPEPVIRDATADGSRDKQVDEQQASLKDAGYRADAGGSLRMKKNRSPTKAQQKSDEKEGDKTPTKQEPHPLQTVFEPPSEAERKDVSPDANLFPNQKFAIDQARASAPPKMNLGKKENIKPGGKTVKLTTNNARIGSLPPGFNPYPHLPPNTKPSAWSTVVKRNLNDDPFLSGKGEEDQSKSWMNDKAARSPQKPRGGDGTASTSPTPSPERKPGHHRGGRSKSQLNAAAKAFTPSSSPSTRAASLRAAAAGATPAASGLEHGRPIPHHHHHQAKKPSIPGQKGSGADARLVTPAEQTLDSARVEQPGPPAKEKKKRASGGGNPAQQQQQQQQKQQQKPTAAQVATAGAAGNAPAPGSRKDFPALAEAAAAAAGPPKNRAASFAQAAGGGAAPPPPAAPAASSPPPSSREEAARPAAPATSPNDIKLGPRGAVSGAAGPGPAGPVGKAAREVPAEDDWTTVGPGKKAAAGGKNPAGGRAGGGGRGGKSTQQGGRGVVGGGGSRAPVGEERKGG